MDRIIQAGEYPVCGEAFSIQGRKILVRHRSDVSEKKPELFLSAVAPYCYISSLYPADEGYMMDEAGKRYRVEITSDRIFFNLA